VNATKLVAVRPLAGLGALGAAGELAAPDVSGLEFVAVAWMEAATEPDEVVLFREFPCVGSVVSDPGSGRGHGSKGSSC
jgi:hypothetical protein